MVNGLTPAPHEWPWMRVSMASDGETRLIFIPANVDQPALWIAGLLTHRPTLRSRCHRCVEHDDRTGKARPSPEFPEAAAARRGVA